MASTRDIRRRIKSVKNTSQITKAMQMVAASKMRRAQQAALAGQPYAVQMNKMLAAIRAAQNEEIQHPFLEERENHTPGVLLMSTDKGLCGALNTNLFREIAKLPHEAEFVSMGKKGRQFLARTGRNLIADFELKDKPTPLQVKQISQFMIDQFLKGKIDSIHIAFPRFINTLIQQPTIIQVLPIKSMAQMRAGLEEKDDYIPEQPREYLFEPNPSEVLDKLLPYYVHFLVYQMLLSARASEHSSRMVAMKNATDNAKQMIKDLTLQYNKARQASITNEIIEISTAQMALN
ncbi:MAG: ATP synthase F1 subunit gamma [Verrucomicrobiota bacterium]